MGREVEHVDVGDRVWSVAESGAEGQDGGEGTMRQFVVTEASRVFRRPQVRTNYLLRRAGRKGGVLRIQYVRNENAAGRR